MNKTLMVIIGVVVVVIMFPMVMTAIHNSQTDSVTETFAGSVVAAGSTTVTLTTDPWKDRTASVTAMTATGAGAVPVASTYNTATNALVITGLGADTPQDITVTYDYDATSDFTGLGDMMGITPLLIWIAIIGVIAFGGFMFARSKMG